MKIRRFVENHHVLMSAWAAENPNMPDARDMNHYRCVFRWKRRSMTVFFSMGLAHTREPRADEVLHCLAMDASGVDNATGFEDWCSNYGYDTDSRKAERIYKTCQRQAKKLRQFCGSAEVYQQLLECEE